MNNITSIKNTTDQIKHLNAFFDGIRAGLPHIHILIEYAHHISVNDSNVTLFYNDETAICIQLLDKPTFRAQIQAYASDIFERKMSICFSTDNDSASDAVPVSFLKPSSDTVEIQALQELIHLLQRVMSNMLNDDNITSCLMHTKQPGQELQAMSSALKTLAEVICALPSE